MADSIRTYVARYTADTSDLTRGAAQAERALKGTAAAAKGAETDVKASAGGMSDGFKKVMGLAAGTLGAAAVIDFGKDSLRAASDVQQAMGAVDSVFKESAGQVKDWASKSGEALGLSKAQYGSFSAVVGSQLKGMGFSTQEAAGQTDQLITLGSDLAATYGGSVSDAVGAVSSLLKGERDPIEKYGVSLKQSDINARLAAQGLGHLEGSAKTQAEAQAGLAILFEKTADAQGQSAREADTAAGAMQRQEARTEDLKATIGEQLLPAYESFLGMVNDKILPAVSSFIDGLKTAAEWISDNSGKLGIAAIAVGTFAAAMGAYALVQAISTGALQAWILQTGIARFGALAWATAQWILNAALSANPIGLVVLALVLLGAALYLAWTKSETFRNIVIGAWEAIKNGLSAAWDWIKSRAIDPMVGAFQTVWNKAVEIKDGIGATFTSLRDTVGRVFTELIDKIKAPFRAVFSWVNDNVISNLNKVTSVFGLTIPSLPTGFAGGGWTGPGGERTPAGVVHADEYVVRKRSQRRMRAEHPGWLDHVNRYGQPPGYADGGLVSGAIDFVKGVASGIVNAVTDPAGFVKNAIASALGALDNFGPMGKFLSGVVRKLLDKAAEWITKRNAPPPSAPTGPVGGPPGGSGAWAAPVAGYRVSAGFPSYASGASHTGIDLAVGRGTPIYAAGAGVVSKVASMTTSYGNHVAIAHGGGLSTLYAHMLRTAASVGQQVAARTLIGYVDSTGNSTGDHLHFEVRRPGPIDPRGFMRSVGVSLGRGGIVTGPTVALIGESGPEAVVPLSRGMGATYNVTVKVERGVPSAEVGREVVAQIRAFEAAAGATWRR